MPPMNNYPAVFDGMPEIWLPVIGYEGLYEISCYGNIRSIDRVIKYSTGFSQSHKGRIRKKSKIKNTGYLKVQLMGVGKEKKFLSVHRLVGIAFLPNPKQLPEINHLKGNKEDNRAWMLAWCNRSENTIHALSVLKIKTATIPVNQYTLTGKFLQTFDSLKEASEKTGTDYEGISKCICGTRHKAGGYKWKYNNPKINKV